jgi:hypothetical protein
MTPALVRVLALPAHKKEIFRRLGIALEPPEKRREWLWRTGHRYLEHGGAAANWHPAGAFWWRFAGEQEWRPVPDRNPGGLYPCPEEVQSGTP